MKPLQDQRVLDRLASVGIHALLGVFALITLVPFAWMVVSAFKTGSDAFGSLFLPAGDGFLGVAWDRLSLDNFRRLFHEIGFANAILNSVFLASASAVLATFFAALAGFALAKYRFRGRDLVTAIVLAAILIPGPLLLAPGYQLQYQLGLLDTYAGLLVPGMVPAFGVFLFRQAMLNSVPDEILECARIDGAGEFRIFISVVLPIVRPMLGAFLLITFLGMWNNYIGPQIVLQDDMKYPLSVALANLRSVYGVDFGLIMSGTLISIAPVLCLFLLLQREFIQGLTSGAVKG